MRCDRDPEAHSRRRAVASLLVFAKELERAGRISKASKGLLKELIVHENLEVMSIGERLAGANRGQQQQQGISLHILDDQIKKRASKSHQELFEICPLEQAHLLSQQDTEALAEGSDTKSLVYGEIDFWSFYDIIRAAADGIDTGRRNGEQQDTIARNPPAEFSSRALERRKKGDGERADEGHIGEGGGRRMGDAGAAIYKLEWEAEERRNDDLVGTHGSRQEHQSVGGGDSPREVPQPRVSLGKAEAGTPRGGSGAGAERARGGGLKFYDLGSGSGKAVFAAVLAVDFRCAVGIELLAGVYRASTRVLKRYRRLVEPVFCSPAVIKLHNGSFLDPACDWSDGDLVFANSTCFADETLAAIACRTELLRPGARVVTFTSALKTPWLRVLMKRRFQMSWGPATVFVHQKLSPEEYARRLTETTLFDEDQGITVSHPFTTTGKPSSPSSAPSPTTCTPGWSFPSFWVEDGTDAATDGNGNGNGNEDGDGSEEGRRSSDGGGFDVEEEGEEEDEEGGDGEDGEGIWSGLGVGDDGETEGYDECLSWPRRPLHC